jgi:4,5-dihydroxyphthalate decarboxylase
VTALPVFTSRQFVQEAVWIRKGNPVKKIEEILTNRCATDDATASLYLRVWLQNALGRDPGKMTCPVMDTASLHRKLAAGELDAAITFAKPSGSEPLVADVIEAERAYYQTTKIFPIMRVVCIRSDLLDRHRWLATSLFRAFEEAKQNSLNRLIFAGMSRYPMPWINAYVMRTRMVFGDNFWPYGIAANRTTLDACLSAAQTSGFTEQKLDVQDLFDEATWDS